jgi:hypothetical protein
MPNHRSKQDVLRLMRRVGLIDEAEHARDVLPDVIDLDSEQDRALLSQVGMEPNVEELRDRLGGSP